MTSIDSVTLEVPDPTVANTFYIAAFDLGTRVGLRASEAPTSGFRGFTLSLVVSQPATVDALIGAALDGGATTLKPIAKSLWGYGGVVQSPDGTIWKVATSSKKNTGPGTRRVDEIVLLLGVADVAASKRFYVDHDLAVAKSYGRTYVQFDTPSASVKLALYGRRSLAKDAGVSPDGTGSHRIVIGSDAGPFTDPDGFAWEAARQSPKGHSDSPNRLEMLPTSRPGRESAWLSFIQGVSLPLWVTNELGRYAVGRWPCRTRAP